MAIFGAGDDETQIKITLDADDAVKSAEKLSENLDKVKKSSESVGDGFTKSQRAIITWAEGVQLASTAGELLGRAIAGITGSVGKLINAGDALGDISGSFEALGGSSFAIEEASQRILGVASNIDLMKIANKGLVAELPLMNSNFGLLADYGKKVADSLGIDATQGIEQLTDAMISGREVALKKLGVIIDSDKAYRDYAQSAGIAGRELSDLEKKTAVQIQAWEQMRQNLGNLPPAQMAVSDLFEQMKAKMINVIGEIGKGINENDNLVKSLQRLGVEVDNVSWEEFGQGIGDILAEIVDLLPQVQSLIGDIQDLADKFILAGAGASDLLRNLQQVGKQAGLVTKVLTGGLPTMEELKEAYNFSAFGLDNYNKQLEKQKARQEASNKETKKTVDVVEELTEAQLQEHDALEEKIKQAKLEADTIAKNKKLLEEQTKAREDHKNKIKQEEEAQKRAFDNLQKSLRDLQREGALEDLQKQLEKALKAGDTSGIVTIKKAITDQVKEGIVDGFLSSGGAIYDETSPVIEDLSNLEGEKIYKSVKENVENGVKDGFLDSELPNYLSEMITNSLLNGFQNGFSKDFLADAGQTFSGIFAQKFQDSFQKMFTKDGGGFSGANIADSLTNLGLSYGISSLTQNASDNQKDTKGGIVSGAILGASYGSSFGPWGTLIGGVVGAGAGYVVGASGPSTNSDTKQRHETINFIEKLIDNKHLSFLQEQGNIIEGMNQRFNYAGTGGGFFDDAIRFSANAFATSATYGLSNLAGQGETLGNINAGGERYDPIAGQIAGPDWAGQYWDRFGQEGGESFQALGSAFSEMAGQMGPQMEQVGVILAENLNGNLDNARMLLQTLGIGAQDLETAFMNIGLSGEESWHTVEVYMQSINDLTGTGLIALGDLEGAMNQFINAGGRGQEALISLRNIAIEGIEAGATSLDELKQKLVASGKYSAEQIEAFFGGLASRGITTLDGLRDANDRTLGGITADVESLGFQWDESVSQGMEDSIENVKELQKVIKELPDNIEKNITLNVETKYSGEDAKALYNDLRNSPGVARA